MSARRRRAPDSLIDCVEGELKQLAKLTVRLGDVLEDVLDRIADKNRELKPEEAPSVPDNEWVRAFRAYETSVFGAMETRRKNAEALQGAGATDGDAPLSDAEYHATVDAVVERRLAQMTTEELGRVMLDRMNQETKT